MKTPVLKAMNRPVALVQPITVASLERDVQFLAYVVEKYGEVYRPILNRLNAELEAMRGRSVPDAVAMPRTPAKVTQADIARAIRAMRAAGYPDVRVVFKDGAVIVEAAPKGSKAVRLPVREIEL